MLYEYDVAIKSVFFIWNVQKTIKQTLFCFQTKTVK